MTDKPLNLAEARKIIDQTVYHIGCYEAGLDAFKLHIGKLPKMKLISRDEHLMLETYLDISGDQITELMISVVQMEKALARLSQTSHDLRKSVLDRR